MIEVQRLDMGLFATRWAATAAGDGVATVAVQFVDPEVCRRCVALVADWLRDELDGRAFDFEARYAAVLRRFLRSHFGGPTIYSLLEAGYRAGIPDFYLESEDVVQWGYGRKQLRGRSTVLHRDSIKDTELTTYKDRAKAFLDDLGLPIPRGEIVFDVDEAQDAASRVGFPVVTKPVAGHKGQGVTTGVASDPRCGAWATRPPCGRPTAPTTASSSSSRSPARTTACSPWAGASWRRCSACPPTSSATASTPWRS